jgi:SAM-dependent methyltransferase
MGRYRKLVILLGTALAAAATVAVARHARAHARAHAHGGATVQRVRGGVLAGDAVAYDNVVGRLVLGSLFRSVAADVAAGASAGAPAGALEGARVLEVGCGPGRLSIRLARRHGLEVTGLDLDPAMIERARANADRLGTGGEPGPSFVVGDAASLPFPDGSFDLVVSTLSMHHWAEQAAGLAEIGRVLRPDGRALVWDFRPGVRSSHARHRGTIDPARVSSMRVLSATPWRWPLWFNLLQRTEMVPADGRASSDRRG